MFGEGGPSVNVSFQQKQRSLASPVLGKSVFLFHGFWNILEMCTTSKSMRKVFDIKMIPGSYATQSIICIHPEPSAKTKFRGDSHGPGGVS